MARSVHPSDKLPRAFVADLPPESSASAALWHRWLTNRDRAAFDALLIRYLPAATIVAHHMRRRRPELYRDSLGELASDGVLGLIRFIKYRQSYDPQRTRIFALREAARDIRRSVAGRFWAGGPQSRRVDELGLARGRLVRELGRQPDRHELLAELARSITNPHLVIDLPEMHRLGETPLRDRGEAPEQPVIDADLRRLAMKLLDNPRDRKLLRMTLAGLCPADIARKLNITRQRAHQLVNGVLWRLRSEKRLADALGVEPAARPRQRNRYRAPHRVIGPARLAV